MLQFDNPVQIYGQRCWSIGCWCRYCSSSARHCSSRSSASGAQAGQWTLYNEGLCGRLVPRVSSVQMMSDYVIICGVILLPVWTEDVAYTSYYLDSDYPVTKVLRDPVYVEVRVLERTDPNLVLTLGRCWATSSPYPQSLPQWDLLIDG